MLGWLPSSSAQDSERLAATEQGASLKEGRSAEEELRNLEYETKFGWHTREHDQEATPDTAARGCTDVVCILFILLQVLTSVVTVAAVGAPVPRGFHDASGQLCGSGAKANQPYLYFCESEGQELSQLRSECVSFCANVTDANVACAAYGNQSMRTVLVGSVFCAPLALDRRGELDGFIGNHLVMVIVGALDYVWKAPDLLLISFLIAIFCSMWYLFFLMHHAKAALWVGITIVAAVAALSGYHVYFTSTSFVGRLCAYSLLLFALSVLCFEARQAERLRTAGGCIEAACEVFFQAPVLILEPLTACVGHFVCLYLVCRYWMALFAMTGQDGGIMQYLVALLMIFGAFWLNEYVRCCSEFVLSFVTQTWFFQGAKRADARCYMEANFALCRYHVGSLTLGALVIMVLRPVRWLTATVAGPAMQEGFVGMLVRKTCCCVIRLYPPIQPFNKGAYMDMAMNGGPYFRSAYHTLDVLMDKATTVHTLNGSTQLFQLVGLCAIFCICDISSFLLLTLVPKYSDPSSGSCVYYPEIASVCLGIVGLFTAAPFMMVYDSISDNLLFCIALHQRRCKALEQEKEELGTVFQNAANFVNRGLAWVGLKESSDAGSLAQLSTYDQLRGVNSVSREAQQGAFSEDSKVAALASMVTRVDAEAALRPPTAARLRPASSYGTESGSASGSASASASGSEDDSYSSSFAFESYEQNRPGGFLGRWLCG